MRYPDVHAAFAATVAVGAPPPPGLVAPGGAVDRRLAIYRNSVAAGLREALARRFPVIARLVGPAFAPPLFDVFARESPPGSPVLLRYGLGLPAFLERFAPVAHLAYLPDVARLEWARGEAWHAADAPPASGAVLAAAAGRDPERLLFRLAPSLRIVASPHPVLAIWEMNQPGRTPAPLADWRPETVLVARDLHDRLHTALLPPADAAFTRALAAGATYARAAAAGFAADAAFDPVPALARLVAAGLVTGVDPDPAPTLGDPP